MKKFNRLMVCLCLLFSSMEVLTAQDKIKEFEVKVDETHNSNTIYSSYGATPKDGVVIVNSTIPDLEFSILSVSKERLRNIVHDKKKNRYLLIIKPNDKIYKQYTITINAKGFMQGKINDVEVKAGLSSSFIVNPKNDIKESTTDKEEETFTVNGVSFAMKLVEGGTFQMGATSEQGSEADGDEKPVHSVTLNNYYMGETEVTQALWKAVMGDNPSRFKGDNLPVEQVSWNDVQDFLKKLNRMTGKDFRLPTEAEWEYAARGGRKSRGYKYAGDNTIGNVAWYYDNSGSKTHAVKTKNANELGLHDMSGNVWEWCNDRYGIYSSGSQTNPPGASSGSGRVLRGGGWLNSAGSCRVSNRDYGYPGRRFNDCGFRLCLPQ